uniref:Autophagy-related protein n=1 Tax=Lactuca sativa TaxID=4236 RepID=A0A9R1VEW9_LACSA|nr:hypothetical protein LSAT_V11C500264990 [Lactuca sativa]
MQKAIRVEIWLNAHSNLNTHWIRRSIVKTEFLLFVYVEKRKSESSRIIEKYPDRVLVIVDKAEKSDIPGIDKKKYLFPADLTIGEFVYVFPGDLNEDFFKNENDYSFMNDIVFL